MVKLGDLSIIPLQIFEVENRLAFRLSTFDFWMGSINFLLKGASSNHSILPFEFLKGKLVDYPIFPLCVTTPLWG